MHMATFNISLTIDQIRLGSTSFYLRAVWPDLAIYLVTLVKSSMTGSFSYGSKWHSCFVFQSCQTFITARTTSPRGSGRRMPGSSSRRRLRTKTVPFVQIPSSCRLCSKRYLFVSYLIKVSQLLASQCIYLRIQHELQLCEGFFLKPRSH